MCVGARACECVRKCDNVHSFMDTGTCICSSAHSCGCVVNGGDAMAAFAFIFFFFFFHPHTNSLENEATRGSDHGAGKNSSMSTNSRSQTFLPKGKSREALRHQITWWLSF